MTSSTPAALGGLLTAALTDPKLKGVAARVGDESLHITAIDQARAWLSLIHISEPTRREWLSRMPSSA